MIFRDRHHAGRALAAELGHYAHRNDVVVLALPRGGVPVAFEVARALQAPLDVFVVRKLGMPGHEELAMGAIASGGVRVLNEDVVRCLRDGHAQVEAVAAREQLELERRERAYRGDCPEIALDGKIAIVVDDGLATGATMRAAVKAVRLHRPRRVVVAVPVGADDTCAVLRREADELVCLSTPYPFGGVGMWYDDFSQTGDDEVRALLIAAMATRSAATDAVPESGSGSGFRAD